MQPESFLQGTGMGLVIDLIEDVPTVTLQQLRVTGGFGSRDSDIFNQSNMLTVTDSTITADTTNFGGALFNVAGNATFTESDLTGNTADNQGGGIFVFGGTVTLNNSSVSNNTPNNCVPMGSVEECGVAGDRRSAIGLSRES